MPATATASQPERAIRARDYLRVSLDRSGRARSLTEQHADHQRVAEEQGWSLDEDSYRAAKRLLDAAKRDGFRFVRVTPGSDGPLWGVRETLQWRDTIYLAGFGQACTASRSRKSPLIIPGSTGSPRWPATTAEPARSTGCWPALALLDGTAAGERSSCCAPLTTPANHRGSGRTRSA